jgi:hypothetical protein
MTFGILNWRLTSSENLCTPGLCNHLQEATCFDGKLSGLKFVQEQKLGRCSCNAAVGKECRLTAGRHLHTCCNVEHSQLTKPLYRPQLDDSCVGCIYGIRNEVKSSVWYKLK